MAEAYLLANGESQGMSPIYTFSIACVAGRYLTEEFRFVVELPADWTLGELASFILDTADFDGEHLADFYLANGLRGTKTTLLTPDDENGEDGAGWGLRLADIFPLARPKRLYYAYDPRYTWLFEIIKKGKEAKPVVTHEYPRLVEQHGSRPLEYGPDDDDDEGMA
jgi:hypothetical protein